MRFLVIEHYWEELIADLYAKNPGLARLDYESQHAIFESSLCTAGPARAAGLRAAGHEARHVSINVWTAQAAWAREHGIRLTRPIGRHPGLRKGWLPWAVKHLDKRWIGTALLAQIDEYKPDVVYSRSMDNFDPQLLDAIRDRGVFLVAEIAAKLPRNRPVPGYDLTFSSLPHYVEAFREAGLRAEFLPLGFDRAAVDAVGTPAQRYGVSFTGNFLGDVHVARANLVRHVADHIPLEIWTAHASRLWDVAPPTARVHWPVWGREMYWMLASSRICLNTHGDISADYANNLRLFEATGMGTLLVTDRTRNLGDLFELGTEVVDYGSPEECVEILRHFLDHPDETRAIASRGQRRTLRDHTYTQRMEVLAATVERLI